MRGTNENIWCFVVGNSDTFMGLQIFMLTVSLYNKNYVNMCCGLPQPIQSHISNIPVLLKLEYNVIITWIVTAIMS